MLRAPLPLPLLPRRAELLPLLLASGETAASDPVLPSGEIEAEATCAAAQSRVPCQCTCRITSAISVACTVRSDSYGDRHHRERQGGSWHTADTKLKYESKRGQSQRAVYVSVSQMATLSPEGVHAARGES